ncbi:MAG: glycosyltransferase family 4 protein [Elusimicrobia bacterium]|nr:glycosyltransferase family 4 protein [Elusimicrobiota bacterium]
MNIALVAGSYLEDATTRSVLTGLQGSLRALSHRALIVSRRAPPSGGRGFPPLRGPSIIRIASAGALAPLVRRRAIDVVHLHFSGWFRPWMLPLARLEFPPMTRLVVTFQDFLHPELPGNSRRESLALRRLLRRAHAVTAVSEFLSDRVEREFPELRGRVRAVPNGVVRHGGDAAALPAGRRPYILSIGRLAPYKGMDLLVMAYAKMGRPDLDLVLCGAPFQKKSIAGLIGALKLEGRVRLTGLKSPGQVRSLLDGCRFYAAAPRAETFGMAIVEAMGAGKAVLATRVGGVPEYLRSGVNGLLVDPGDVEGLCRGLERLAGDAVLRKKLAAGARETARGFAWDRIAGRYLGVYAA